MTQRNEINAAAEQIMNNDRTCGTIGCQLEEYTRAERIRALNDVLRTTGQGGIVLMTDSVVALGLERASAIYAAVTCFDAFTPDNDPYGEHNFGTLSVDGLPVNWKIDYYDRELKYHSPNPACPRCTVRVLTILLASEY